ncbi:TIGR03620 family F420-dependent LLM class oxidoreductase [Streptomyces sp. NBC_00825]|uniref:TIGR03620 family F420-dependent LLM class oxidoreductase n=1 Tax=unclassified Streptomyces TaxID=2593676 RepID=UPI002253AA03|nr:MULTISPECIES: TIGR03620 family F420-dependent LLM class oxidoreductase [unclassified Streptomyces]WTB59249.1 TIGR03620 family F420-dependent LLM class oxidoreductase [Streptomyces sp. NBC_00826]WTH87879.1 TIGR03620 family F420-dependent LLM class oxidoreductase [Streptomyces sp. NBC_00825]WTH96606.1 TIGR03620 family F420-dependent LLM class oxidoreductase [Streptomyces sp. NBC_00822]MCX4870082.1 TIGR03620 family F420-dependent LLM class oxidoreductase [Streptomyces sp. NBC_00906]MCX4901245.
MTDSGQTELGQVGIWTFAYEGQPAGRVRESAAEIEELGYGAIWYGEAFGRDTVGQAWLLLSATQRIVVASGIANIAFRDPIATATATRALGEAFPGRYVLGLGGHRVDDTVHELDGYPVPARGRAVTTMRAYLQAMDAVPAHGPMADPAPRRVLAALGPKMLQLAAEHTWGAHPYFVSTEHTAQARQIMGPNAFLAVEQAVVLDTDLSRARQVATEHVAGYLSAPHQEANVGRLGFNDEDIVGGPSRRMVDALVAQGEVEAIRRRVQEHLDAGADHVCLQVLTADATSLPEHEWRELAAALLPHHAV